MPAPPSTAGGGTRVIAAAIALVTLVGLALATSGPLVSLEIERWGVSSTVSGLTATLAGFGTVLMVPLVPGLARRFGIRAMLTAALLATALTLAAFPAVPNLLAWSALRFALGAAIGVIFTLSEFWINAAADPARRGLVMGLYATTLYLGFAAGPAVLALIGTAGALPFLVTAAIILLGLAPLAIAGGAAPGLERAPAAGFTRFIRAAPAATLAAFVFGAVETGLFVQLPVHNVRVGFSEHEAALLLSAFTLGNVLFQLPLGLLSDRLDRRTMLLALALLSAGFAAALPLAQPAFWPFAALLLVFGGISGALYTVGLAHLGSRFSDADLASANAAFVLLYSLGLMLGPPLIGLGMDAGGAYGLPAILVALLAGYAGIVVLRLSPRRAARDGKA
ncbi:MFS transporter [Rhabdaerophilum calidifontis]|uniref:MFS transporter n=1 Tax=Rhabdaerophilum calidifontis TaxID=2604328 RepID=UPI001238E2F5|nr:MFS transporter [Rhabdaerophilum calidifontis]